MKLAWHSFAIALATSVLPQPARAGGGGEQVRGPQARHPQQQPALDKDVQEALTSHVHRPGSL